jgi:hypothetical protein
VWHFVIAPSVPFTKREANGFGKLSKGAVVVMVKGQQAWIRIRGAPSDPESFDLATWNGMVWEIPRVNSLGDAIYVQIADYVVIETMPASTRPEDLYRKP